MHAQISKPEEQKWKWSLEEKIESLKQTQVPGFKTLREQTCKLPYDPPDLKVEFPLYDTYTLTHKHTISHTVREGTLES